jgi:tetratricopeptide (TPR) repeat protein
MAAFAPVRSLFWACLALALAMPAIAASDPRSAAEANKHVAEAQRFHEQQRYADALAELEKAYALDPQPRLLFAMGQLNVQLGRCERAILYYERFLATRPGHEAATLASDAIETCKTAPPPAPGVEPTPAPIAEPLPPPAPPPPPPRVEAPAPAPVATRRPWYRDYVADGLVAGGIGAAIASGLSYRSALDARDRADAATEYDAYVELVDRARSRRTLAVVLGASGVALATAGAIRFVLRGKDDDGGLRVAASGDGGFVGWSGRF